MNALISNPADCEVRGVIRFLRSMVNMLLTRPVSENGA